MTVGGTDERVVLTPEILEALAGLHDLQLADIRHLAPGHQSAYWLVVSAIVTVLLLVIWLRRPRQRRLRRLATLRGQCCGPTGVTSVRLADLVELLREAGASAGMPPGRSGEVWLGWLDSRAPATDRGAFTGGVGRQLLVWPYLPESRPILESERVAELFALVGRWLKANG